MTAKSHYLLIKYWSPSVLTRSLMWTDPWDQRSGKRQFTKIGREKNRGRLELLWLRAQLKCHTQYCRSMLTLFPCNHLIAIMTLPPLMVFNGPLINVLRADSTRRRQRIFLWWSAWKRDTTNASAALRCIGSVCCYSALSLHIIIPGARVAQNTASRFLFIVFSL